MRRTLTTAVLALAWFGAANSAQAQYNGAGYRPFGAYPYGYLGYYPGAYSNSWSNGFNLYGPPVPTYGITPGAFGGSNYRLNNNINIQNGASIGLGRSGGGVPRSWPYAGANYGALTTPNNAQGQAAIEVRVPAENAEVSFEGVNTQQKGTQRLFASPQIPAGVTHFYKIRAKWTVDGDVQDRTRSIGIRANERFIVDFTKPEGAGNAPMPGNQ